MVEHELAKLSKRDQFEAEAVPHMDALYRTALRMTRNGKDAEDLVQEVYLKAFRFWHSFESGSNCRAWLFKILTNTFINGYRAKSRSPISASADEIGDDMLYGQLTTTVLSDNPEEELFSRILDDDVKAALEELPDSFRLVVVLSFLNGFSYQEIADITSLPVGTVKSRLHRGRHMLQDSLYGYAVRNGYLRSSGRKRDSRNQNGTEVSSLTPELKQAVC